MQNGLKIIVAVDEHGGYSKDGKIPWIGTDKGSIDLRNFQHMTKGGTCVMGRRTYQDMLSLMEEKNIDVSDGILKDRTSFVITSDTSLKTPGATAVQKLRTAVERAPKDKPIWILGGYRLWIEAFPSVSDIHLTLMEGDYDCDKQFPTKNLFDRYVIIGGSNEFSDQGVTFVHYKRAF